MREIVIGGTYLHFKGFIAKVITVAIHTETGVPLVIYQCFGSSANSEHSDGIYARPLGMFLSEVDRKKYPDVNQKYRFELIDTGLSSAGNKCDKDNTDSGLAPATSDGAENFEIMPG